MRGARPRPSLITLLAPAGVALLAGCGSSGGAGPGGTASVASPTLCTADAATGKTTTVPFGWSQRTTVDESAARLGTAKPVGGLGTHTTPEGVDVLRVPVTASASTLQAGHLEAKDFQLTLPDGRTCEALSEPVDGGAAPVPVGQGKQTYEAAFHVPEGTSASQVTLTYVSGKPPLRWSPTAKTPQARPSARTCVGKRLAGTSNAPTVGYGTDVAVTSGNQSGSMKVSSPEEGSSTDLEQDVDARAVETTVSVTSDAILQIDGADVVMTDRKGRICPGMTSNVGMPLFGASGESGEATFGYEVTSGIRTSQLRVWYAPDHKAVAGWR